MKRKQFDTAVGPMLGEWLTPLGFTTERSAGCAAIRWASDEICHVVLAVQSHKGNDRFAIRAFCASPIVDPTFELDFPDDLGIVASRQSALTFQSTLEASPDYFHCRSLEELAEKFTDKVGPALVRVVEPHLRPITTVEQLLPLIDAPLAKALALQHVGRHDEAKPLLDTWLARAEEMAEKTPTDARAHCMLEHLKRVIAG